MRNIDLTLAAVLLVAWGCSSTTITSNNVSDTGGRANADGSSVTGGMSSSGTKSTLAGSTSAGGMSSAASGGSSQAGTSETGGASGNGGATSAAGNPGTGGTAVTGRAFATGGTHGTGGSAAVGGLSSNGGTSASTGGASVAGGAPPTGGSRSAGGTNATGGSGNTCPMGAQGCACYATGICAGANVCTNNICCSAAGDCTRPGTGVGGGTATGGAPATGGATATGGALGYCASQSMPASASAWLCDDFDSATQLQGFTDITSTVFTSSTAYSAITSHLTGLYYHSAPYSASLASSSGLWWSATGTAAITDSRVSFWLNPGQFDPAASQADVLQLAAIDLENGALKVALVIHANATTNLLEYEADWEYFDFPIIDTEYDPLPAPPNGQWTHIEIDCNPVTGTYAIYYNGVNQYTTGRHMNGCVMPAATANVFVGMAGTWAGIIMRFDDITSTINR